MTYEGTLFFEWIRCTFVRNFFSQRYSVKTVAFKFNARLTAATINSDVVEVYDLFRSYDSMSQSCSELHLWFVFLSEHELSNVMLGLALPYALLLKDSNRTFELTYPAKASL